MNRTQPRWWEKAAYRDRIFDVTTDERLFCACEQCAVVVGYTLKSQVLLPHSILDVVVVAKTVELRASSYNGADDKNN